jgi:hypothetical protein
MKPMKTIEILVPEDINIPIEVNLRNGMDLPAMVHTLRGLLAKYELADYKLFNHGRENAND